jgi:hypothetical protein
MVLATLFPLVFRAPSHRRPPSALRLFVERLESRVLPSFVAPLAYDVGRDARAVAVGDFAGNHIPDLAVADFGSLLGGGGGVSVLLGNGDGTFQTARTYGAGDNPWSLVVGDFRGNGILDLAVADAALLNGTAGVSVLLGNGDGSFQVAHHFNAGRYPRSLAVGDFLHNGILDLVVANQGSFPNYRDSSVSILLGNGDGTFAPPIDYPLGSQLSSVAVADLSGNRILDLVVTKYGGNAVSVLMGNGDGTFQAARDFAAGPNPYAVAVGAFRGDGIPDLVVTNYNGNGSTDGLVSVLLGNGDGTFQAPISSPAGYHPTAVAVGDFTHNGILDFAYVHDASLYSFATHFSGSVDVRLGNGDGSFRPGGSFVHGIGSQGFAVADLRADGQLDVAVANLIDNTVSVLLGNSDGSFQAAASLGARSVVDPVAVADLTGNGIRDIVVADYYQGNVSVYLGNGDGSFQAPEVIDVGPAPISVTVGDLRGNGILDLVVGLSVINQDNIIVLLGNGDGTFQAPLRYDFGAGPLSVVIADFNGDDIPDLAVANANTNQVTIALGNGDGTFQPARNMAAGTLPRSLVVGDFKGNGILDLAVADAGDEVSGAGSAVAIFMGNGDGTFQAAQFYPAGRNPWSLAMADFTGNRILDLAVADNATNGGMPGVSVLLGNGDGTFRAPVTYPAGAYPWAVSVGDFEGDGIPSLAVAGGSGTRVLRGKGDGSFQTANVSYVTGYSTSVAVGDFYGNGLRDLAVASPHFGDVLILANDGIPMHERRGTRELATSGPFATSAAEPQAARAQQDTMANTQTRNCTLAPLPLMPSVQATPTIPKQRTRLAAGLIDRFLVESELIDLEWPSVLLGTSQRFLPANEM